MQKRTKPPDRRPIAGATIPLIVTRTVDVQADQIGKPAANQRHDKLNCQGKPKKASKAPPAGAQRVERKTMAEGSTSATGGA
jgi:hypothetical protein